MAKPAQFPILRERQYQLSARPVDNRPAKHLRIEPDPFNRLSFSAQVATQTWINLAVTRDEWEDMLLDLEMLCTGGNDETRYPIIKNNAEVGAVLIGKDSDGLIFVEISDVQKGSMRFYAKSARRSQRFFNNAPMPENILSARRTRGWVNQIRPLMARCLEKAFKAENAAAGMAAAGYNNSGNRPQYGQQQQPQYSNYGQQAAPTATSNLSEYVDL